MKASKKTLKTRMATISALLFVLVTAGCGPDTIAPGDKGDFCEKASDCAEELFCLDNVCMHRYTGPLAGTILIRVSGLSQDVRVTISGPEDYDRMTSAGRARVDSAPGGTYSVGCEEVAHHTVSVETQDDTIDTEGESIEFTCVYVEEAVVGTILVGITGIDRDVDVTIQGANTYDLRSNGGEAVLENAPGGTYQVSCEEVGGYALAVDPSSAVLDAHGATLQFTCTYTFDAHWFAVGHQGTLLASVDAATWSQIDGVPDANWSGIAYGDNMFVLVGDLDVAISADGLVWTSRPVPAGATHLAGVVFGGGTFVVIDRSGSIWSSPGGVFWGAGSVPQPQCELFDVTYGNGRFLAVGAHGGFACTLMSEDGASWTDTSPQGVARLNGAAYADGPMGFFLSAGMYGSGVWSFDGGGDWSWNDVSQTNQIHARMAYGDGRFVMVGHAGGITLVEKGNPSAWTSIQDTVVASTDLNAVTYGDELFVAVGYGSAIFRSDSNGENWERSFGTGMEPILLDVLYTP